MWGLGVQSWWRRAGQRTKLVSDLVSDLDPEAAFRRFIDAFNKEDLPALDDAWTSPFSYVTNGEAQVFARYRDFVNFEGLRASGWARTQVSRAEMLLCDDTSAVIDSTLTRLAADDTEIASGTLVFVLVRDGDGWKLRVGVNLASFSTGKT